MGYYFSSRGNQKIIVPASAEVMAYLSVGSLEAATREDSSYSWQFHYTNDSESPIKEVLDFIGFDIEQTTNETLIVNDEPCETVTYVGYFDTKFNSAVNISMQWLGSLGVGYEIECVGEDNEMWQYRSETGTRDAFIYDMVPVPRDVLAELEDLRNMRAKLDSLLSESATKPEDIMERVRQTLEQKTTKVAG